MSTLQHIQSLIPLASVLFAWGAWLRIPPPRGAFLARLGLLLTLGLMVELAGAVTMILNITNGPLYTIYNGLEFIVVLSLVVAERPELRKAAVVAGVFGIGCLLANVMLEPDARFMANLGIMTMAAISAVFVMIVLWRLTENVDGPLWKEPRVWLYTGMLLYFAALVPAMGSTKYIWQRYPLVAVNLWTIVQVLAVTRYVLTGVACLKTSTRHAAHGA